MAQSHSVRVKATIGFTPNTTNGFVHPVTRLMSISHMQVASVRQASPALKIT